jgi:hypothetical protein
MQTQSAIRRRRFCKTAALAGFVCAAGCGSTQPVRRLDSGSSRAIDPSHPSPTASASASARPCSQNDYPPADLPQCARCVGEGTTGFCADGVLDPACVEGRWSCSGGDLVPRDVCSSLGAPCTKPRQP